VYGKLISWPYLYAGTQAKNAFDHLNGFHLMDRYLVGAVSSLSALLERHSGFPDR
jgi:hypothetical protein